MRARLFARRAPGPTGARGTIPVGDVATGLSQPTSIQPALVAEIDHFEDEDRLLVVVQAGKQRLGSIRHVALIDGTVVEELGLVAHLFDDVVRWISFGARNAQIEAIGAVMPEIMH